MPAPPARLRLALAEQRAAGTQFEEASRPALTFALRGVVQRRAWSAAFESTRSCWASAYVGHAPTGAELALAGTRELSGRELPLTRGELRYLTVLREHARA